MRKHFMRINKYIFHTAENIITASIIRGFRVICFMDHKRQNCCTVVVECLYGSFHSICAPFGVHGYLSLGLSARPNIAFSPSWGQWRIAAALSLPPSCSGDRWLESITRPSADNSSNSKCCTCNSRTPTLGNTREHWRPSNELLWCSFRRFPSSAAGSPSTARKQPNTRPIGNSPARTSSAVEEWKKEEEEDSEAELRTPIYIQVADEYAYLGCCAYRHVYVDSSNFSLLLSPRKTRAMDRFSPKSYTRSVQ